MAERAVVRRAKAVGDSRPRSCHARQGNKYLWRPGTLWIGRFKSALVDHDRYLLTCYRYIELNPVLAGMVVHPRDYRWSSHHCNAQGIDEARITPHPCYLDLGLCPTERQQIYRSLFQCSAL